MTSIRLPISHLASILTLLYLPILQLAHGIKRYMDQKQSVGENLVLCDDDISWGSFNDGFPNLFINNVHRMVKRDVIFLANFYPAEKIFEQLAVISMLPRYLARRVLVILPFFPTGKKTMCAKKTLNRWMCVSEWPTPQGGTAREEK